MASTSSQGPKGVVPIVAEQVKVDRLEVETGGGVRVHKRVVDREVELEPALARDTLSVDRVAIGRIVEEGEWPQTRTEGDVTIVPVLEEVLVVHKRIRLKEEI